MESNGTVQQIEAPAVAPRTRFEQAARELDRLEWTEVNFADKASHARNNVTSGTRDFKLAAIQTYGGDAPSRAAEAAIAALAACLADEADLKAQQRALAQQADETKALVMLNANIDGKNESIRSAQLTAALRETASYQAIQREITAVEGELAAASNGVRVAQAQLDAAKSQMRLSAATLELLAH